MGEPRHVTDLNAPELDVFARLTESQLRNRRHAEEGLFIAESPKVIACALDAGCVPVSLLLEERQLEGAKDLLARCGEAPVFTGSRETLAGLTGYALTRGWLCAMRRPSLPEPEAICKGAHRVAVLDGLTDPSNVGAVFRSAAAMGMDALLVSPTCCDPFHRRATRVSMGTVFQIPWARLGESARDWPGPGLARLRAMGLRTVALALEERSLSLEDPALHRMERLALLLGNEGNGLSPETISLCDLTVKIPMSHGVDSLNVAAASAVAFWELRWRG